MHHFQSGSHPTVSKFIFTVFRDNSTRIIHRSVSSQFLQRANGIFPKRLSFSVENKDPLEVSISKTKCQKLSLDHFKGCFSSVTGSKWEACCLNHDISPSPSNSMQKQKMAQSRFLGMADAFLTPPAPSRPPGPTVRHSRRSCAFSLANTSHTSHLSLWMPKLHFIHFYEHLLRAKGSLFLTRKQFIL